MQILYSLIVACCGVPTATSNISLADHATPGLQFPLPGFFLRKGIAGDVILNSTVAGFRLAIQLRPDGSWQHWDTNFSYQPGPDSKLHLPLGGLVEDGKVVQFPTSQQKQTLAEWRAGRNSPYELELGDDVVNWAKVDFSN